MLEDEKLTVLINGQEAFKAGDINKFLTGFEVLNTELVICHMDPSVNFPDGNYDPERARLCFLVQKICRQRPKRDLSLLDAIYTPIRNVKYEIENYRVEGKTDYEKLLFEIENRWLYRSYRCFERGCEKFLIHHFMVVLG